MKLSTDRILTTHVGSLPRPQALFDPLMAKDKGTPYDAAQLNHEVTAAVDTLVARQVAAGLDVVCDGEVGKTSYTHYVRHRLSGIEAANNVPAGMAVSSSTTGPADMLDHQDFAQQRFKEKGPGPLERIDRIVCTGPIKHSDLGPVLKDIANLQAAAIKHAPFDIFMNAASPGVLANFIPNTYYNNEDAYIADLADAMKIEYEAIANAGITLQIDSPDLAMVRHMRHQDLSDLDFLKLAERSVEAVNHATANISPEKMRIHICWGNYPGPHTYDIAVAKVLPIILKARPHAISFEGANPRHEHEWEDWRDADLPDEKVLIPGVLDSGTNFIEHPRLIAQRIIRYADIVGRERVLPGADCGFGTFLGRDDVSETIVWKKFEELTKGGRLASEKLWD